MAQKLDITKKHSASDHAKLVEKGVSFAMFEDTSIGEKVCKTCGYVLNEKIIDRSAPPQSSELGEIFYVRGDNEFIRSIYVGQGKKDASGATLSNEMQARMYRLRRWDNRTLNSNERRMKNAYQVMINYRDKFNINFTVIEGALKIYEEVVKLKALWKESKDPEEQRKFGLMGSLHGDAALFACIYMECGIQEVNLTINKICNISGTKHKAFMRAYKGLVASMKGAKPIIHSANDFVPSIVSLANIPRKATLRANEIIIKLEKYTEYKAGKDPTGVAASVLYIACLENKLDITQKQIAVAAGITEVTIRNRYNGIVAELKKLEVNPAFSAQLRA